MKPLPIMYMYHSLIMVSYMVIKLLTSGATIMVLDLAYYPSDTK